MKMRKGKYPNKNDFDPYYDKSETDNEGLYALPLSDPAETNPIESFQNEKASSDEIKPSAFSENKKMQLNVSVLLV